MNFDAIAPWYRALEWIAFGEQLQRCRVACLGEIAAPRRALIVGEGNGRFLCELLREYPAVEVDCLDASARMLQLARERVEQTSHDYAARVRFIHEDIAVWTPPASRYDLIVTHFVLDCFREPELSLIIKKLADAATKDATWLLADFCIPAGRFARARARVWLTVMYQFFRFTARIPANELIDPTAFMRAEGFTLARQRLFQHGMLRSEMWRNIVILPVRPADMLSASFASAE
ncbi:MAG TPA: class I SAM-dependent methyltransferase [Chthoniobacterales bacterium]|nr:class I SAM-dependent methyltransferase [Chthoniobacterales bacterium]